MSFLRNHKLFCSVSVLSDAILTLIKILNVINVCFYGWLIWLLTLTCFVNNDWSPQSNAACFTPLSYLRWKRSFCSYTFFENYLNFWVFYLILIWQTIMPKMRMSGVRILCERKLPSLLFEFDIQNYIVPKALTEFQQSSDHQWQAFAMEHACARKTRFYNLFVWMKN